jgi:uncharacterized phiE125 gp8 family phage protein
MPLRRTGQPAIEPVSLAEAKLHLRVDGAEDDALIGTLIAAAREEAEHRTHRSFITTTWALTEDSFPEALRLRMGRVLAVSQVRYRDPAGAWQVLSPASYTLDASSDYANWLFPAAGYAWPATWDQPNGVEVIYTAGFGPGAADVPASLKAWLLLTVGVLYAQREAGVEKSITELPRAFYHGLLDKFVVPGV